LNSVPDHYLDITSDVCPITFVKTKLMIEKMAVGEVAEVRLGEGEALENVPRSVKAEGHQIISMEADSTRPGVHILVLTKTGPDSAD
jgi:TusA-related sulfurtransferase